MSTTAGLGSGDYVAINGNAIASVLLGVASGFLLMGNWVLLLLPLAGIICGGLAFRQIVGSNGTQAGRGLAGLGLLLCLGLGGFYSVRQGVDALRNHGDQDDIVHLITQFGDMISADRYADAYTLLDERMKQQVPLAEFALKWKMQNSSPLLGRVAKMEWNNVLEFGDDAVTGDRIASGQVLVSYEKVSGKNRYGTVFRKLGSNWWIDDIPEIFPARAPGSEQRPLPSGPVKPAGPPAPSH